MKKLAAFLLILSSQLFTVSADNIGFIDVQQVLLQSEFVKTFQRDLEKKGEAYQKLVQKNQEKIEKAKAKNKSDDELAEMFKKIEEELRPKEEELAQLEANFEQELYFKLMEKSAELGKEYGVDVVLDKRVIFHGGFDLTNFVLEKLK